MTKYLAEDPPSVPPAGPSRAGDQPWVIEPFVELVEAWLRVDVALRGAVIHERLVAEHGFTGSYHEPLEGFPVSFAVSVRALV